MSTDQDSAAACADVQQLLHEAIGLAVANATADGRRFSGVNRVTADNDLTAHAEVMVIRRACRELGTFDLSGATLYTSCEPCPLCLSAALWARLDAAYFTKPVHERSLPVHPVKLQERTAPFEAWAANTAHTAY